MSLPEPAPPPYPGPPIPGRQQQPTHPSLLPNTQNDDDLSDNEHPSARHLDVPHIDGMDDQRRRSMEDEERDLPEGWIRQFDEQNGHQFFVDTKANPPRSIWVHPYDDEEYIRSIPDSHPSQAGTGGGSSHLPEQSTHHEMSNTLSASEIRERREAQDNRTRQATEQEKSEKGFGEKLKEKLTGSTKQERDQKKRQKIQAERELQKRQQEQFLARREALLKYHKEHRNDPQIQRYYPTSSVRYASPLSPYSRSPYAGGGYYGRRGYGGGYGGYGGYGGGGMGMPLMMGGLGGLGGGLMMGSMMGGGFGGGGFGGGDCGGGGF